MECHSENKNPVNLRLLFSFIPSTVIIHSLAHPGPRHFFSVHFHPVQCTQSFSWQTRKERTSPREIRQFVLSAGNATLIAPYQARQENRRNLFSLDFFFPSLHPFFVSPLPPLRRNSWESKETLKKNTKWYILVSSGLCLSKCLVQTLVWFSSYKNIATAIAYATALHLWWFPYSKWLHDLIILQLHLHVQLHLPLHLHLQLHRTKRIKRMEGILPYRFIFSTPPPHFRSSSSKKLMREWENKETWKNKILNGTFAYRVASAARVPCSNSSLILLTKWQMKEYGKSIKGQTSDIFFHSSSLLIMRFTENSGLWCLSYSAYSIPIRHEEWIMGQSAPLILMIIPLILNLNENMSGWNLILIVTFLKLVQESIDFMNPSLDSQYGRYQIIKITLIF